VEQVKVLAKPLPKEPYNSAMAAELSLQTCLSTIYIYISMQKIKDRVQKDRVGGCKKAGCKMTGLMQKDRVSAK
jgi:hypothetical protein